MAKKTDFLIIGSGIAGFSLALKVAKLGKVTIVTKKRAVDANTTLAQGGIACVLAEDDSFELHIADTLKVGDGLAQEDVVSLVVCQAPDRIKELLDLGVPFTRDTKDPSKLHLTLEGGHSRRRIVHVEDHTGREVEQVLLSYARKHPNIEILENHLAVDLITLCKVYRGCPREVLGHERCLGAYVLNAQTNEIETFLAKVTVLATGGAGKVYLYTSNADVASGDGIALAYRAGCRVANLEFVQFHPTCLYHPKAKNFLISEALRGEGAILLDPFGKPFMHKYDPEKKELAPRDIVARAIDFELKKTGKECVYLDISHKPKDFIIKRFPYIYETCLKLGIDITREPIPVVPAAHYFCGGIVTDRFGLTDIKGLYALGECTCTGFHGANRLASNSLLEGLAFAHQAAVHLKKEWPLYQKFEPPAVPDWDPGGAVDMEEKVLISHNWDAIRRLMWNYVGIVRTEQRLRLAQKRLNSILEEIEAHYWDYILTSDFIELRNLAHVAKLVIECAIRRKESRGTHFMVEYPQKNDALFRKDTILWRARES
ncbi:L-aspartate oxidase [Thermodesulfatator indicus DSM 15286]|uniref:L-aspartate oxidase n=1 Tax=Thermodesulfatator indicus (strain DSM 15286 / JCM 11887 / CIR29812) TaxID=667014 RepID=F8A9E5_THEID|nr:L-aspartate oxidase [Thermodesulfatator indicus]AEH44086.1 L-aspartate oxidase [Thermodesulfatator indicus DSM 15286]